MREFEGIGEEWGRCDERRRQAVRRVSEEGKKEEEEAKERRKIITANNNPMALRGRRNSLEMYGETMYRTSSRSSSSR